MSVKIKIMSRRGVSHIVAPIELKIGPRARFRVSGLLGPFSAHSEHLSYCELDLDDPDLYHTLS